MSDSAYEVKAVHAGTFRLDGGAMFGVVPKVLWSKTNPPDDRNRITLAMRPMLAVGSGRVILVDTGMGDKIDEKMKEIYAVETEEQSLSGSLQKLGYAVADVTDVIISHLHFDHCGGSTVQVNGDVKPTFPNATYYVQRENWESAIAPNRRERASYLNENYVPLDKLGVLKKVEGHVELFPGVEVIPAVGHTSGHQIVKVSSTVGTIVFCADLIPTSSHLSIPYVMSYDLQPVSSMQEKEQLLAQAEADKWILFFEHDPSIAAATIRKTEKGYAVDRVVEL